MSLLKETLRLWDSFFQCFLHDEKDKIDWCFMNIMRFNYKPCGIKWLDEEAENNYCPENIMFELFSAYMMIHAL